MDAPEVEKDVKLQRKSADFIADLSKSLKPFLWKTQKSGRASIRRRVRVRETDRLVNLLEPFQEDPQLLDPHLDKLVPVLADALLAYLRSPPPRDPNTNTQLLVPLSRAICRLLYTFCKVRGEKVIVRFFSTETRHLELLLSAIEKGSQREDGQSANPQTADTWDWEERYITLLWLSQLLLAPFDLASISSEDTDDIVQPTISGLTWPANTPGLTIRAVPLALRYLSSSGKERDAAKALLVRIAMRKDMQELGILKALVQWAISSLQVSTQSDRSTYYYIGVLSFLAGILVSSEGTADMNPYLEQITRFTEKISAGDDPVFKSIIASAVARKTILKILRTIAVLLIHNPESMAESDMAIEATIDHMLDSLADSSTPVRLAASKALSAITLRLPEEMAVEVGLAVLENLKKNLLYAEKKGKQRRYRDLSRVNPLQWHGLMLTLAHLLYRRSIPANKLPPILNALRLGLAFEQRSTSGSSIGTNVRDAACFGIWAMARRYLTKDLQLLKLKEDVFSQGGPIKEASALQTLATDLVISASLDPAGNIRRGSSAALQELIGRHPNTIAEGIKVVQVVDYHAVALRSRAVQEVALQAAQLSDQYYQGLFTALLGWRGIRDGDSSARRTAAHAIGKLVWAKNLASGNSWKGLRDAIDVVGELLKDLSVREVEDRHGLILALTAIIENFSRECSKERIAAEIASGPEYDRLAIKDYIASGKANGIAHEDEPDLGFIIKIILSHVLWVLTEVNTHWTSYRNIGLMAESSSRLLMAVYPLLRVDCILRQYESLIVVRHRATLPDIHPDDPSLPMPAISPYTTAYRRSPAEINITLIEFLGNASFATDSKTVDTLMAVKFVEAAHEAGFPPDPEIIEDSVKLIDKILNINDTDSVDMASVAAADLLLLIDDSKRSSLISSWNHRAATTVKGGRTNQGKSYIHTLFKLFPLKDDRASTRQRQASLIAIFHKRWNEFPEIEIRVTILNCLAKCTALHTHTEHFIDIISEGLDDYTTNARGDVGSLVRIEAAKAAGAIWNSAVFVELDEDERSIKLIAFRSLFGKVLRVAAEKLDRVRIEGQKAVGYALSQSEATSNFSTLSNSSQAYFRFLLEIQTNNWLAPGPFQQDWVRDFMEGYVTSADTGAEDLVRASRAALAQFCEAGNTMIVYRTLLLVLSSNLTVESVTNNDRVIVPCLEVISFLFDARILQEMSQDWSFLYKMVQEAHYKTGNVRKLEASIKVYGGLYEVHPPALNKLITMIRHPFPKIRNLVADELWVIKGVGKGVNWATATRKDLARLMLEVGIEVPKSVVKSAPSISPSQSPTKRAATEAEPGPSEDRTISPLLRTRPPRATVVTEVVPGVSGYRQVSPTVPDLTGEERRRAGLPQVTDAALMRMREERKEKEED